MRPVVLVALVLALAGCGGEHTHGTATLWVTSDRGAHVLFTGEVPAGLTAMQALVRAQKVETRYGGRYVQAIDGVSGSLSAREGLVLLRERRRVRDRGGRGSPAPRRRRVVGLPLVAWGRDERPGRRRRLPRAVRARLPVGEAGRDDQGRRRARHAPAAARRPRAERDRHRGIGAARRGARRAARQHRSGSCSASGSPRSSSSDPARAPLPLPGEPDERRSGLRAPRGRGRDRAARRRTPPRWR